MQAINTRFLGSPAQPSCDLGNKQSLCHLIGTAVWVSVAGLNHSAIVQDFTIFTYLREKKITFQSAGPPKSCRNHVTRNATSWLTCISCWLPTNTYSSANYFELFSDIMFRKLGWVCLSHKKNAAGACPGMTWSQQQENKWRTRVRGGALVERAGHESSAKFGCTKPCFSLEQNHTGGSLHYQKLLNPVVFPCWHLRQRLPLVWHLYFFSFVSSKCEFSRHFLAVFSHWLTQTFSRHFTRGQVGIVPKKVWSIWIGHVRSHIQPLEGFRKMCGHRWMFVRCCYLVQPWLKIRQPEMSSE